MVHLILLLLLAKTPSGVKACVCQPKPEIAAQIQKAESEYTAIASTAAAMDFDKRIAPLLALHKQYPDDLFVNERYQDAVVANGIEGHLKFLTQEYQALYIKHYGDPIFQYLYLRSLVGRSTRTVIQELTDMVRQNPNFAPAHQTLAEIYGSPAFHDEEKQKAETAKFRALCPGSNLAVRPDPLPDPSPLVAQAEQLLANNGDPDHIIAMTEKGLLIDEWRNQRIRAFDWYSTDFKLKALAYIRDEYWRAWAVQVRCYRKAGKTEKAESLLAQMEADAAGFRRRNLPDEWTGLLTLAQLYIEGRQMDGAARMLEAMRRYLTKKPDAGKTETLTKLEKLVPVRTADRRVGRARGAGSAHV